VESPGIVVAADQSSAPSRINEENYMKFARIVYGIAAVYGFIVLLPLYFSIDAIGRNAPPPVTHPEFYFGFVGVAVLWQVVLVLIARDPLRYRPLMPIAILEKIVYSLPVAILYLRGQAAASILASSLGDPVIGVLFAVAFLRTRMPEPSKA
jgi:hypothetical protein